MFFIEELSQFEKQKQIIDLSKNKTLQIRHEFADEMHSV